MTKRMLIDATHPEETRVVLVSGNRLEDYDHETSHRTQLKGNIYLAKVTRVEPSLQAAFVDYGGNRHGFLAFSEIHPDYYRIPISDREELLQQDAAEASEEEDEIDSDDDENDASEPDPVETLDDGPSDDSDSDEDDEALAASGADDGDDDNADAADDSDAKSGDVDPRTAAADPRKSRGRRRSAKAEKNVDTVGGDEIEDIGRRKRPQRRYRIQEVISRRQILLVQVAKEERGNKGAAITSYISLAGRYCVLMPNTPRGGGISRKIANMADRKRLKKILDEFDIPEGMAVIVRTAGAQRTKAEIRRDYEYLIKLWEEIRDNTLKATAPAIVHEEANLIKRSIRDLYNKDIDEILVEGDDGYRAAKDFMKLLMPSHAKHVKAYKEPKIPLYQRYQVESQIDNIHSPIVQLKSGGYIVLNSTEALVAIDVNSGRATRERNIEETAVKTNQEAAEEVARQLKLRDLAGLIVIDFIDMEDGRNRHSVERRLKNAMASDRARIQIGRISAFGLLEMSRQRLRPSVIEASTNACPTCGGTGLIRSTESTALTVLRAIEEEGIRQRADEVTVHVPPQVAFYLLNQKRGDLTSIEARYEFRVMIEVDEELIPPDHRIEKTASKAGAPEDDEETTAAADESGPKKRRRRGGRKRRGDDSRSDDNESRADDGANGADTTVKADDRDNDAGTGGEVREDGDEPKRGRRRGRRGGRRRRGNGAENAEATAEANADTAGGAAENGSAKPDAAKPDDTADTPAEAAEASAVETASAETGNAADADDAKPEEEKPSRRRRTRSPRSRKPKAADEAAAGEESTSGQAAAVKADGDADRAKADADAEAAPAEEKPKRARRTRKKPVKAKEKDEDSPTEKAADSKPADKPAAAASAASGNGAAADKANGANAEAPAQDADAETKPKGKKRRGWWSIAGK